MHGDFDHNKDNKDDKISSSRWSNGPGSQGNVLGVSQAANLLTLLSSQATGAVPHPLLSHELDYDEDLLSAVRPSKPLPKTFLDGWYGWSHGTSGVWLASNP